MKTKQCSFCDEIKPVSKFYHSSQSKDGYGYACMDCRKASVWAFKKRNPNRKRKRYTAKRYIRLKHDAKTNLRKSENRRFSYWGLPTSEYNLMLDAQSGVCAICHKPELTRHQSGKIKALGIDHDHSTNAIRGLLCNPCNRALGMFFDDPKLLQSAIEYLHRHANNPAKKIIPFNKANDKRIRKIPPTPEANWESI